MSKKITSFDNNRRKGNSNTKNISIGKGCPLTFIRMLIMLIDASLSSSHNIDHHHVYSISPSTSFESLLFPLLIIIIFIIILLIITILCFWSKRRNKNNQTRTKKGKKSSPPVKKKKIRKSLSPKIEHEIIDTTDISISKNSDYPIKSKLKSLPVIQSTVIEPKKPYSNVNDDDKDFVVELKTIEQQRLSKVTFDKTKSLTLNKDLQNSKLTEEHSEGSLFYHKLITKFKFIKSVSDYHQIQRKLRKQQKAKLDKLKTIDETKIDKNNNNNQNVNNDYIMKYSTILKKNY
ncbi:hypothetical protein DERP_006876 [Dermatophagoides pteronyssinus]|uniref:Uncharacterized protein n=1 Tax=Dermatophagoides pteronyssinus TaxID=6956 RepID=A0ABQ8IT02_DERPT|nr:hypothetical protein DERP_006876 [Dermatophagoides pteronyssinus]